MDLWLNEMFSRILQWCVDNWFWVWLIGMSAWGFIKYFILDL